MRRIASAGAIREHFTKPEYQVNDLFYASWAELSPSQQAEAFGLWLRMKSLSPGELTTEYGLLLIMIMRCLRKNQLLVNQISEAQVVDCFNEVKPFFDSPWFAFWKMDVGHLQTPADKMATSTFDHFIYADNEFSLFLIKQDINHLKRLVATLYQKDFNKEAVDGIAAKLKLKEWQLLHVFYTFKHVREFVMKRCKNLMPKGGDSEEVQKPVATGAMWLKLKHRLSETMPFAGYDNAGRANMYAALDYLEDLAQQAEKRRLNG